jgi:hypothetical protein
MMILEWNRVKERIFPGLKLDPTVKVKQSSRASGVMGGGLVEKYVTSQLHGDPPLGDFEPAKPCSEQILRMKMNGTVHNHHHNRHGQ